MNKSKSIKFNVYSVLTVHRGLPKRNSVSFLDLERLVWNFNMQLEDPNEDWMGKHQVFTLWRKPELKVKLTPRHVNKINRFYVFNNC